ncbi:MAG: hypothetical protein EOQ99_33340 [Mesorhizobium sp.]|nr:MAG: hypothetical protein EOQ99_33340 [Mesorhizobium sp.]
MHHRADRGARRARSRGRETECHGPAVHDRTRRWRVIALSVASTYDDASRSRRSSSAAACLGLTPRRYESGEISRNGRISKRGDKLTRTYLYEAERHPDATNWLLFPERLGPADCQGRRLQEAKVAVARKLAVLLHAMWKTNEPVPPRRRSSLTRSFRFPINSSSRDASLPERCADEVAPTHAVLRNRENHFDPPVPTQTCGDPCDRPRREP